MGYTGDKKRAYQLEWLRKRRTAWLKENGPCAKCGSLDKLEVDHLDPAQKVAHRVWSWSESRRLAELSKCQVLCESCHQRKTIEQMARFPCGTRASYERGCRCPGCCEALREHWRRRRASG